MNTRHIYADGVERLTMLEGMVRLDLFCYEDKGGPEKAARRVTEQIVLPPAAFLRAYEAMGELVRRMEEGGVVKRRDTVPAASEPHAEASFTNSSPNFE